MTTPSHLLHVGPHKTGTTTVQHCFHVHRAELEEHGVHYLGDRLQPTEAAKAVAGETSGRAREAGMREWQGLMADSAQSRARTRVLSSEFFCTAPLEQARTIAENFAAGGDLRVVITLRSLGKILPSQWQQWVQVGTVTPFEDWLWSQIEVCDQEPPVRVWRRHRHDLLVRRWAEAVGAENVTVLVADQNDNLALSREFARILDIPEQLLIPMKEQANRSLSWEETEVIRHFNIAMKQIQGDRLERGREPLEVDLDVLRRGWSRLKGAPAHPGDHKILVPPEAVQPITDLSAVMVDAIMASGVEVIGPVEQLRQPPTASPTSTPEVVQASSAGGLTAAMATSLLIADRQARRKEKKRRASEPADGAVAQATQGELQTPGLLSRLRGRQRG